MKQSRPMNRGDVFEFYEKFIASTAENRAFVLKGFTEAHEKLLKEESAPPAPDSAKIAPN